MSGKMKNGLELSKQSWEALRQNRQLLVFPIISMVMMTIVSILFLIPAAGLVQSILDTGEFTQAHVWPWLGLLFLYYLIASIVVIFSNAALVGANKRILEGQNATVGDGLRIAFMHFGTIVKYALITATVGVLVRLIIRFGDKSDNIVVAILSLVVGGAIAAAWSLAVFFAIPVMVFEDLNVRDSLKRSVDIFKKTWGEGFTGDVAIGGLSCLVYLAIFLVGGGLVAVGVMNAMSALIIFGVLVVVLGTTVINLLYGAVNGIFQTSLYHYALTGDAGPFIDTEMAKAAFKSRHIDTIPKNESKPVTRNVLGLLCKCDQVLRKLSLEVHHGNISPTQTFNYQIRFHLPRRASFASRLAVTCWASWGKLVIGSRRWVPGSAISPRRIVAHALISLSLQTQKAAGMTESALVADSQSAFGVTRLYESCGFKIVDRDTVYRKPL